MTDHFDSEEDFHAKDRKQFRKERRQLQESDRSKFKKTNLVQKPVTEIPEGALKGRVIAVTGEGIWVDSSAATILCTLKGLLKKEKMH
ncbi:MAG TPA: hypothetical protein VGO47_10595, partial [Chlamydiales bacterium]|nr:hypothetical protein [Chlamydiales bacterium]